MHSGISLLAVLLAACGPTPTRSNAGSFVTNVRFQGKALVVDHCDVEYGVGTDEAKVAAGIAATIVMLPLAVATGGAALVVPGNASEHDLATSQCGTHRDHVGGGS